MPRSYRFALAPRWLFGHLVVLALAVTMILLGRWQLDVSNSKHFDLQNFGYTLQWWAFTVFGLVMWARILRDGARARAAKAAGLPVPGSAEAARLASAEAAKALPAPVAYRRYVMPQMIDGAPKAEDQAQASYNAYLAGLADQDRPVKEPQ